MFDVERKSKEFFNKFVDTEKSKLTSIGYKSVSVTTLGNEREANE